MLTQRLKAARAALVVVAVLGSVAACAGAGAGYHPAPYLQPGVTYPQDSPAGGG